MVVGLVDTTIGEIVRVDVFKLLSTGADDPAGAWTIMTDPREIAATPEYEDGEEMTVAAGGKTIYEQLKKDDQLMGGEVSFGRVHIDPEAFEVMCGGEVELDVASPSMAIGYEDPLMADAQPYFKMRCYAPLVRDKALTGTYIKAEFAKCRAQVPEWTLTQGDFAVPDVAVTCEENANASGGARAWRRVTEVDALGD